MQSDYPFLLWWSWEYVYLILLSSSSNRKYDLSAIVLCLGHEAMKCAARLAILLKGKSGQKRHSLGKGVPTLKISNRRLWYLAGNINANIWQRQYINSIGNYKNISMYALNIWKLENMIFTTLCPPWGKTAHWVAFCLQGKYEWTICDSFKPLSIRTTMEALVLTSSALNVLKWIHQNIPGRLLAHAFVKVCHLAQYLCAILPQRSVILPQHIIFHLALRMTIGLSAPCQLYAFSLSQSKRCENVKKK